MKKLGKDYHTVNIHVVKDIDAKYALARQLYNPERRTIFFVYRLDVGEKLAKMFEIPFFSGEGKDNNLVTVLKSHSFVASKRYEHGLSIKDLEHIIETDFQFGGRQEEMQRTGRLMHSESTGKTHDIVVTQEELEKYGKRFHALYEKGFKPRMITHLLGVTLQMSAEKTASTVPRDAKNWRKEVRVLYAEGFFRKGRYNADVITELKRRGVSENDNMKNHMSDMLMDMVQAKLLYKTPTAKGIEYVARDTK
jgi:superfamily II DNA/RNA helicase